MSAKFDDVLRNRSSGPAPGGPTAADIVTFLRQHPNFLNDHPDLIEALTPPASRSGRRVLDMQYFMVARLQQVVRDLKVREADLLANTRHGRFITSRVHAAVLALCEPHALDNMMEIISNDLPTLLEIDVVVIGVESEDQRRPGPLQSTPGVYLLSAGGVERVLGNKDIVVKAMSESESALFGGAATLVKSAVLLRLRLGRPGRPAVLALGSRDADRFQPGQSTEMLTFLAETLGRRMREWLDWTF